MSASSSLQAHLHLLPLYLLILLFHQTSRLLRHQLPQIASSKTPTTTIFQLSLLTLLKSPLTSQTRNRASTSTRGVRTGTKIFPKIWRWTLASITTDVNEPIVVKMMMSQRFRLRHHHVTSRLSYSGSCWVSREREMIMMWLVVGEYQLVCWQIIKIFRLLMILRCL